MEIFIYYVVPNAILFGSLYFAGKYIENATAHFVNNYEESQQILVDFRDKFK